MVIIVLSVSDLHYYMVDLNFESWPALGSFRIPIQGVKNKQVI